MEIIKLNTGNLWTEPFLNRVIDLNKKYEGKTQVASLYGSIAQLTPTARAFDRLPFRDWTFLDEYIAIARKNNIHMRYTLNMSCLGSMDEFHRSWETKLKKDIQELHDIGVDEWTVCSPLLVQELTEMFPGDLIEVSTIAEVKTPNEYNLFKEIGAKGLNLATSINRDFNAIRAISAIEPNTVLLANEACIHNCPYRRDCYNLSSHNSGRDEKFFHSYPFAWCNEWRIADPVEWIRARLILPQWMRIYQEHAGINWFKISFRTHPYKTAIPILEKYMSEQHDGNLLELWPTIAHLGHTDEPIKGTNISCKLLDEIGMINYFMTNGHTCANKVCDVDCNTCEHFYEKSVQ